MNVKCKVLSTDNTMSVTTETYTVKSETGKVQYDIFDSTSRVVSFLGLCWFSSPHSQRMQVSDFLA